LKVRVRSKIVVQSKIEELLPTNNKAYRKLKKHRGKDSIEVVFRALLEC
jgi:arsenate reductase-like glutaredoxin family protein